MGNCGWLPVATTSFHTVVVPCILTVWLMFACPAQQSLPINTVHSLGNIHPDLVLLSCCCLFHAGE